MSQNRARIEAGAISPITAMCLTRSRVETLVEPDFKGGSIMSKMFTAEEVAVAVVEGNRALVQQVEELCNRVAVTESGLLLSRSVSTFCT